MTRGPADDQPGELEPQMLLFGLTQAIGRFARSGSNRDVLDESDRGRKASDRVFTAEWSAAIFESLNWSVSLDERLRRDLQGRDWTTDVDNGTVVRAMRYARNSVHHDWAAALDHGPQPPENVSRHEAVFDLTWVEKLPSGRPDPKGAASYADALAGEKVADTLLTAVKVSRRAFGS
jgi:hypothetical protein